MSSRLDRIYTEGKKARGEGRVNRVLQVVEDRITTGKLSKSVQARMKRTVRKQ